MRAPSRLRHNVQHRVGIFRLSWMGKEGALRRDQKNKKWQEVERHLAFATMCGIDVSGILR